MDIEIITDRIMIDGKRCVRIKKLYGLTKSELPVEYLAHTVHCYYVANSVRRSSNYLTVVHTEETVNVYENTTYPEQIFNKYCRLIFDCGNVLKHINKQLNEKWEGSRTYII